MENILELFVNGTNDTIGQINLYGDEPISLNISIQDVKDISKRNSTFSQTFTIPADKNNNILLNHIFNIGSDSTFDPRKKTPCFMLNDTVPVFTGQFQLTKINVKNKNVISYECVVYGDVIDLAKTLGDKLLTDLDVSEIDHSRNVSTIEDSWFADTKSLGYYYPLIDYGYDLNLSELNSGVLSINYDNGYATSATSNTLANTTKVWIVNGFVGTPTYQVNIIFGTGQGQTRTIASNTQTVLTLTTNWTVVPDSTSLYTITRIDSSNPYNSTGNGMIANIFKPAVGNYYLFNKILNQNGFTVDSNFINSDMFSQTIIPYNGSGDESSYYKFNIRLSYQYNIPNLLSTDANRDTFYIRFHRSSLSTGIATNGGPRTCFCQVISRVERVTQPPVVGYPLLIQDYVVPSCTLDNGATNDPLPPNWQMTTNNSWRYPLIPGEQVWVEVLATNQPSPTNAHYIFDDKTAFYNQALTISGSVIADNVNTFRASLSSGTFVWNNTVATTWLDFDFDNDSTNGNFDKVGSYNTTTHRFTYNDYIIMKNFLPANVKQIDYIKSICTMFNLMVIPSKTNPRKITFIPRTEYYNAGIIKNWTNKVDHTTNIEEIVISEQQNRTIKLSYKEDKDFYNTDYKENTNTIFGEYINYIDNDWVDGEKKIDVIFSPTPVDKVFGSTDIYLPKIAKRDLKTGIYGRTDFNIRFLRKRPLPLITQDTIQLDGLPPRNYYPFCSHLDHPTAPLVDYNFGSIKFSYYKELTYLPADNLVNLYWKTYLDEISDKNAKLIKCKIYLTPNDIATFNYNDSIYIDGLTDDGGHYFYVNKITYAPTSNLPSTVELIKTFKQVPFSRRTFTLGSPVALGPIKRLELGKGNFTESISITQGNNNIIGTNSDGAVIIGDGNIITDNTKNVVLINTFNKTVDEPFTSIVGNSYFPQQGESYTLFNDIDSGLDMIINPFANTILNDIDSGLDAVRNIGGQSIISDIDSGVDGIKI